MELDKLYFNGVIHTLDDDNKICSAIGIKEDSIAFVGSDDEALSLSSKEKIDLKGKALLPGFVDSHLHLVHYAFVESSVKLFEAKNVAQMVSLAKEKLEASKDQDIRWLYCRGWNENNFIDDSFPTKEDANAVSTEIPVIFTRVCGHKSVVNDVALEMLQSIPQFDAIKSDVDLSTGMLRENAVQFFYSALTSPSQKQVESFIRLGMRDLNKKGITAIQPDDFTSLPGKDRQMIINAYTALQFKEEMTVRVHQQCLFEDSNDLEDFISCGYRGGIGGDFYRIGPLKLLLDGSLGAETAALTEGYINNPSNHGVMNYDFDWLYNIMSKAADVGMNSIVHCIGDKAMDLTLDVFEKVQAEHSNMDMRNGIVHVQITRPEIIDRMAKNDVCAFIQPVFVPSDMDIVEAKIGAERTSKTYQWKTLIDKGILTVGGSDAPVESFDILENIYFAVTRKKLDGTPEGGWLPDQCLSVDEAVKLFTKYPAYTSFSENINGTLEVGKLADMVILDKSPYAVKHDEIKDIKVLETIVGGKTVYER